MDQVALDSHGRAFGDGGRPRPSIVRSTSSRQNLGMTENIATVASGLRAEIERLRAEAGRLTDLLGQLDGDDASEPARLPTVTASRGKKRGRKPKHATAADVEAVVRLIRDVGNQGVRALKLSRMVDAAGLPRVGKVELLASDRVKVSGNRGGTTYRYSGG